MYGRTEEARSPTANPLDLLEEIASAREWTCDRMGDEELVTEIAGRWSDYRLHFAWNHQMGALQVFCGLALRVPRHRRTAIAELLNMANQRMWLGHFDLPDDDDMPLFRHTMPLRGMRGASVEQLEDVIEGAVNECERYHPAFQFVVWGGKSAAEAVAAALVETRGEA
ncbi:MAG: hypothetical protein FJX57_12860 [Alphaproteobacteria bacterium]|nr:hypothetical protein [Alphaproteobacteria bacterium]